MDASLFPKLTLSLPGLYERRTSNTPCRSYLRNTAKIIVEPADELIEGALALGEIQAGLVQSLKPFPCM